MRNYLIEFSSDDEKNNVNVLSVSAVFVFVALMHDDSLRKLTQKGGGEFHKAGMPADNVHKLFGDHRCCLRIRKFLRNIHVFFKSYPAFFYRINQYSVFFITNNHTSITPIYKHMLFLSFGYFKQHLFLIANYGFQVN